MHVKFSLNYKGVHKYQLLSFPLLGSAENILSNICIKNEKGLKCNCSLKNSNIHHMTLSLLTLAIYALNKKEYVIFRY